METPAKTFSRSVHKLHLFPREPVLHNHSIVVLQYRTPLKAQEVLDWSQVPATESSERTNAFDCSLHSRANLIQRIIFRIMASLSGIGNTRHAGKSYSTPRNTKHQEIRSEESVSGCFSPLSHLMSNKNWTYNTPSCNGQSRNSHCQYRHILAGRNAANK